jgi:hypothetical protein
LNSNRELITSESRQNVTKDFLRGTCALFDFNEKPRLPVVGRNEHVDVRQPVQILYRLSEESFCGGNVASTLVSPWS